MCRRKPRVVVAAWCLAAMVFGQVLLLPGHIEATGEVGRPPLPDGIVRLPFDGPKDITQVPGCGLHDRNAWKSREGQELNGRAFDFGLYQEPVLAAGEGNVIRTYTDAYGALVLVIDHGNGVRSYYVHLQEFSANTGDHVQAGQPVGISGNTGLGAAYHLHFAVTINNDDNPESIGEAANINDLPGIPWDKNILNSDGYVQNCGPTVPNETAVGGAVAQAPEAPAAPNQETLTAISFNRDAAVDVAFGALHENYQFENDSANLVSKALWGGGLPQTDEWAQVAAASPDELVDYLITPHRVTDGVSYQPGTKIQIDWSDNNAQGAELGDVIAYDWEGDGTIDHVAIVTNINDDGYPEVSEHSPTQENRYWSYSESYGDWIEFAFPGSVAYLIHISPITLPDY